MCLAIPGEIKAIREDTDGRMGRIAFGGITRDCSLAFVPDAKVGDHVLVHAGFAIARLAPDEAALLTETLALAAAASSAAAPPRAAESP